MYPTKEAAVAAARAAAGSDETAVWVYQTDGGWRWVPTSDAYKTASAHPGVTLERIDLTTPGTDLNPS